MEPQKKIRIQAILGGFAALLLLVGLDQWTKALAVEYLARAKDIDLIPGVLTFIIWKTGEQPLAFFKTSSGSLY